MKKTNKKGNTFPSEINDHQLCEAFDEVHVMCYKCLIYGRVNAITVISCTMGWCIDYFNTVSHEKKVSIWEYMEF